MTLPPLFFAGMVLLAAPTASQDKADVHTRNPSPSLRDEAAATAGLAAGIEGPPGLGQPLDLLAGRNRPAARPESPALLQQKDVSFQTVLELVRERNEREQEAVVQLVQKYRGQVYKTFQGQGPTFTERQEAWYRVWGLWEAAGSPADQRNRLIAWFEGGIRNSMPGKISPLAPRPQFTAPSEPSAATGRQEGNDNQDNNGDQDNSGDGDGHQTDGGRHEARGEIEEVCRSYGKAREISRRISTGPPRPQEAGGGRQEARGDRRETRRSREEGRDGD